MLNPFVVKLNGFARLATEDVAALERLTLAPRPYVRRQDIIREGDPPGPVFVVLDGWACRYKILPNGGRQILAFLIPGDCCDLHAGMLAEMDHGVQALTDSRIAVIPREEMDAVMSANPAVARAMYIAQLVDEGVLRTWIISMGRRTSAERVAHLMCELYLRVAEPADVETAEAAIPLSQVVLADALGLTPVHINRVLQELRRLGAMDLRRGQLIILDPVKLVQVAGFDENYLHRRLRQGGKYR